MIKTVYFKLMTNLFTEPSIKCYDCNIDTNTTITANDIPDCLVNANNYGNLKTCPSPNHFCMSVHVGKYQIYSIAYRL